MAILSDPMGTVDGLGFHRRVPPWIKDEDIIRRRQIQPMTTSLQANQKQLTRLIILKLLDDGLTVVCTAVKISISNLLLVELLANDIQEACELRKDQGLMTVCRNL